MIITKSIIIFSNLLYLELGLKLSLGRSPRFPPPRDAGLSISPEPPDGLPGNGIGANDPSSQHPLWGSSSSGLDRGWFDSSWLTHHGCV